MKGRVWLILGVLAGIAVAAGRLPYLAGAGRSLAATTERLVLSGANRIVSGAARHGAPRRAVLGIGGVLAVLVPGITALLLIEAARVSLRIRTLISLLIVAVGAASYVYQPHGAATGVLLLALAVAGLAVALTGPVVAFPLSLLAGLIGASFLPTLFARHFAATQNGVDALHVAIYDRPGHPLALQIALLVAALLPFAWATKLVASG
ncbi:MAG TPA: hypothetical protein VKI19_02825 [Acidimicrobiales bacterium]|nr:hypothetical protein [Acidimicrobiales bacterium]